MFQGFKRPQYQVSRFEVTVSLHRMRWTRVRPDARLEHRNLSQVRWSQDYGLSTTGLYERS
jgi:hypothetical protein